jgi:acetoin:2,6-dichlorophenolindophenol oxidoreductase subunit alpha
VIYVCENNTGRRRRRQRRTLALPDVAARAAGYGIPGVVVDGNDVIAVYEAASRRSPARAPGDGPTLIECKTYRWRAHTERKEQPDRRPLRGDRGVGRKRTRSRASSNISAAIRVSCPRRSGRRWTAESSARSSASVEFAKASPFPAPEAALDDVFAAEPGGRTMPISDLRPGRGGCRRRGDARDPKVFHLSTDAPQPLLKEFGQAACARPRSPRRR